MWYINLVYFFSTKTMRITKILFGHCVGKYDSYYWITPWLLRRDRPAASRRCACVCLFSLHLSLLLSKKNISFSSQKIHVLIKMFLTWEGVWIIQKYTVYIYRYSEYIDILLNRPQSSTDRSRHVQSFNNGPQVGSKGDYTGVCLGGIMATYGGFCLKELRGLVVSW